MSRKHFKLLADALKDRMPEKSWLNKRVQWVHDVKAIASACKQMNERFNFSRFYDACGLQDDERE